jgi:hypothetical protein
MKIKASVVRDNPGINGSEKSLTKKLEINF